MGGNKEPQKVARLDLHFSIRRDTLSVSYMLAYLFVMAPRITMNMIYTADLESHGMQELPQIPDYAIG